jgi:hypothetical protein
LGKKKSLRGTDHPERLLKVVWSFTLANLGAEESAVIFNANTATTEKVRHRGDGFFGILRAGADREDKVAERKFSAGPKDLSVFLHNLSSLTAGGVPLFNVG